MDRSVFKLNAVSNTLHILFGYIFVSPDMVDLFLDIFGVGQLGSEIAVVGKQKHTGCVAVETAYGVDAFVAGSLDEIHHSQTSVGIIAGGHAVFRLVEQDVALAFQCHYLFIIFNHIAV